MKYITYLNKTGTPDIRLFSGMEQHKDIAYEMRGRQLFDLLGAGFVTIGRCTGRSESLSLDSRGDEDTKILRRAEVL
jgi:hypothetical protein